MHKYHLFNLYNMTGGIRLYTLSAYYHKSKIDFMDKKHPLFIGSCGTYHLYTIEKLLLTVQKAGLTISFYISHPDGHISILMENRLL